jgi:hypothetical protein
MESSYLLNISAAQQEALSQHSFIPEEMLAAAIAAHAEQIGYMLQAYFPKEKIRKVAVIPGSMVIQAAGAVILRLEFVKEEFNLCSAIDSELKDSMAVTITTDSQAGVFNIKGENWPEL